MSPNRFFTGLGMTSLTQIIVCLLLIWLHDPMKIHAGFMAVTIFAMLLFSVFLFVAAKVSSKSTLTRLYIQLIMISVFLKMLLCLALIIGYTKGFEPANNLFIWPFLIIYISSTVYEVIFIDRVGHEKPVAKP